MVVQPKFHINPESRITIGQHVYLYVLNPITDPYEATLFVWELKNNGIPERELTMDGTLKEVEERLEQHIRNQIYIRE